MTGKKYKDGFDHDTLDEMALINEFSGNKIPLDYSRNANRPNKGNNRNYNKQKNSNNNNNNNNKQPTRRGGGGRHSPYPPGNPNKNDKGGDKQPVASSSKDK